VKLEVCHDLHVLKDQVLVAVQELLLLQAVTRHETELLLVIEAAEEHGVVRSLWRGEGESVEEGGKREHRRDGEKGREDTKGKKTHLAKIGKNMSARLRVRRVAHLRTRRHLLLRCRLLLLRRPILLQNVLLILIVLLQILHFFLLQPSKRPPTPLHRLVVHFSLKIRHAAEFDPLELAGEVFEDLSLLATEDEGGHHLLRAVDTFAGEEVGLGTGGDLEDGAESFVGVAELLGEDEGEEGLRAGDGELR
jgi:hypothetical protein